MGLHFFLLPSGNFGVLVPCFISTTLSSPFIEAKQKNLDSTSRSYITQISFFAILYRLVFPHECISFEIQTIHLLIQVLTLSNSDKSLGFTGPQFPHLQRSPGKQRVYLPFRKSLSACIVKTTVPVCICVYMFPLVNRGSEPFTRFSKNFVP